MYERLIVVTRKTRLEELVERFNSRSQARFYIEHAGGDFSQYVREDEAYRRSLDLIRKSVPGAGLKTQTIDRGFLPTFLFTEKDVILTAGQDGLVANTAKYVKAQPIVAVNPDPERIDGVLLPFQPAQALSAVEKVQAGRARMKQVTLAEASLNDGQRLLAFNELFIGASSHVSARYRIQLGEQSEPQSSSGVIVSTGAGSTGWLSSAFNMAAHVAAFSAAFQGGGAGVPARGSCDGGTTETREARPPQLDWQDPRLVFVVREPFASKHSSARIVAGMLEPERELVFESLMPSGGVIFSDGIEADFLAFNSGALARVRTAAQRAQLAVA